MQETICNIDFVLRFKFLAAFEFLTEYELDPYREFSQMLTNMVVHAPVATANVEIRDFLEQHALSDLSMRQKDLIWDTLHYLSSYIDHHTKRAREQGYRIVGIVLVDPGSFKVMLVKHYHGCSPDYRTFSV